MRLAKGGNTLEIYVEPALWQDPEILSIADAVEAYVVEKPGLPHYTHVEIELKNGTRLTGDLDHPRGSEKAPFSDEVMAEKFRSLARVVLPHARVERIMQTVNTLESLGSMSELVPLLQK